MDEYKSLLKTWGLSEAQVVDYIHAVTKGFEKKKVAETFFRSRIGDSIISLNSRESLIDIILDFTTENNITNRDLNSVRDYKAVYNLAYRLSEYRANNSGVEVCTNNIGLISDIFKIENQFAFDGVDTVTASLSEVIKCFLHIAQTISNIKRQGVAGTHEYSIQGMTYDYIKVENNQKFYDAFIEQWNERNLNDSGYSAIAVALLNPDENRNEENLIKLSKEFKELTNTHEKHVYYSLSSINSMVLKLLSRE